MKQAKGNRTCMYRLSIRCEPLRHCCAMYGTRSDKRRCYSILLNGAASGLQQFYGTGRPLAL
eukprot:scaffold321862_cov36-Prasinocladus_malaysianus.AAC.1